MYKKDNKTLENVWERFIFFGAESKFNKNQWKIHYTQVTSRCR